jgi:chorismate--pyruvate lyase
MARRRLRNTRVPEMIRPWLHDRGSLTARLKMACTSGDFRVQVLAQGWGRPLYSERALLGMRRGEIALVREVALLCGGERWVFARTLIPASTLRGPARRLVHLGERPLGEVLFSDPHMQRGETEVARLLPRHPLFASAVGGLARPPEKIWGRRTLYYLSRRPLLVNEIFLPAIPESPR